MKNKFGFVLSLCCLSALLSQCRKDDVSQVGEGYTDHYLEPYLDQNFLFNAGSYWIYKDSASQVTDSVYNNGKTFTDVEWYSVSGPGPANKSKNSIRFWYNNTTNRAVQYNYYIRHNCIVHQKATPFPLHVIHNPVAVSRGDSIWTGGSVVKLDTCVINSMPYYNVYKCLFHKSANENWDPDSGYVYLKPGIGVLRAECYFLNGQYKVYDLQSYHIQ